MQPNAFKKSSCGNSLVVQWLGVCTFTSEVLHSISGRGTKIPQATWLHQKKKREAVVQGRVINKCHIALMMKYLSTLPLPTVQFSSVAQSCPILCDPMNRSMPGLPVHHQLLESTQTHRVSDAIQPAHPLSSPSPPAPNPSQHQGLFQRVSSPHTLCDLTQPALPALSLPLPYIQFLPRPQRSVALKHVICVHVSVPSHTCFPIPRVLSLPLLI